MSGKIVVEEATKFLSVLVEDYERLAEELLKINLEEIIEKRPDLSALILMNLADMKTRVGPAFIFIDSMNVIKEHDSGTV